MNKLAVYLKPYWKAVLAAPLLMLVEVVTDLLQPRLMASIVDQGILKGDTALIVHTGLLMIGVALLGVLGGFGCIYYSSIAAQSFGTDLRSDLFGKVQSFSFSNLDKFSTGSLITRLTNDITQVQNAVLTMLRILVRAPLLCVGGIIMALIINPGLALILLVTVPVLALTLAIVIRRGFPLFAKVQQKLDQVNTVMRENLAGVRVIKAFVRSGYEKNRFGAVNKDYMEVTIQASQVMGLIMPVMLLVLNMSILGVIWFGGFKVHNGSMLVGEVMAFINYMVQILFSLMLAGFMLIMVSRAKVSADRIQEVLTTETDINDHPYASEQPLSEGRVEFRNVSFRYNNAGGDPVLRDVSFTAYPGQTLAIIGATGSGKTTLVNLISRFYEVTAGQVLIDGKDVKDIKLATLRDRVGMILQESILFTGTVIENIRWGAEDATEEQVMEAAQAAQAHEFILELPDQYETVIGQRGVNLSGGQKQRLAIARALIKKPVILIMDDSTSAVDVATEGRIREAISNKIGNCTKIMIAQRISSVMEADKILVLDNGTIAAEGNHQQLMESSAIYQDIYHSQMGSEVA